MEDQNLSNLDLKLLTDSADSRS